MEYNTTWAAISQPGETAPYFAQPYFKQLDISIQQFSLNNAWWLADICRLTYKDKRETRKQILESNGFTNVQEMNVGRSCGLVCSGKDINNTPYHIIAFKGTDSIQDWVGNFTLIPEKWRTKGTVHKGFADAYRLLEHYIHIAAEPIDNIILTGHSLGGALAHMAATTIPPQKIHSIYTFGMPKVGDAQFCDQLRHFPIYNICNSKDLVPKINVMMGKTVLQPVGEYYLIDNKENLYPKDRPGKLHPTETIGQLKLNAFMQPPEFVSDHAPVNYCYHIEQLIHRNMKSKTL